MTYDYDNKGNVASLVDAYTPNSETISFTYDALDRLLSAASARFSESYSYNPIGTFVSKGGVSYSYPAAGNPRPHAPTSVGGNAYTYDANGNLLTAEGRTYGYDVENRLASVSGGPTARAFTYDGDGLLRTASEGGNVRRYVTPEYQVNPATGEVTVYYRFGGRIVAWSAGGTLRHILGDHLSSTHAEINTDQSVAGQRRYFPFGSDRAVSGISDLTKDERFTSQRRIDSGGGNSRAELYHYGARWYLPGVGIFSQPDTVVPDGKNPQGLNRYSYVYNNPVKYVDSAGQFPLHFFGDLGLKVGMEIAAVLSAKVERARRDEIGGRLVADESKVIAAESAKQGVDPVLVSAVLRHESSALERRFGLLSQGLEEFQARVQKTPPASIGPGQMQLRRALELEELGYVSRRKGEGARIEALLGKESSVEYVAGELRYLSDQLQTMSGFNELPLEVQQRLILIGYNLGWESLRSGLVERGSQFILELSHYDDQTLDEYLRWVKENAQ